MRRGRRRDTRWGEGEERETTEKGTQAQTSAQLKAPARRQFEQCPSSNEAQLERGHVARGAQRVSAFINKYIYIYIYRVVHK